MDKPIPEAVQKAAWAVETVLLRRMNIDNRLDGYTKEAAEEMAEAAITAAQQQGQAVASLEGFREPVTLWGKAYEYDRHGREAVVERRKPIVAELLRIIDTAPPSAPVGDNGYESFARSLVAKYGFCNWQCEETWAAAQAALAQQPAAVDEAMVDRFIAATNTEGKWLPPEAKEMVRTGLTAALATQHQEPTT